MPFNVLAIAAMNIGPLTITAVGAILAIIVLLFIIWASRFKRCPANMIMVIYGKVGRGVSARCLHGGAAFVWPLVQDYSYMSLTPMTISIPLEGALSQQNIRINVPSTFTVAISAEQGIMNNAAERLLNLRLGEVEEMAKEIIFGQLRLTVASLTIEEINQDRERFLDSIRRNVEPELNKIGLYLINVNITDITDESDYIESIGKKAASEAINRAKVDVAVQDKMGAIGHAEASREQTIRVAENVAQADKGKKKAEADRRIYVQGQEAEAVGGENTAKADIADANALLATKEAAAFQRGEVARREAEVEIQKAQYQAELERLNAEEVVREETDKRKVEIAAEAKGVRQVLDSKAAGYAALVASCSGDAKSAATLLMVEKIEDVVARQVEAIKNLKIDKVTVWDSGGGEGGSSTAGFVSSLIRSLPPLHDVAAMAGVDLPEYLGKIADIGSRPDDAEGTERGGGASPQE